MKIEVEIQEVSTPHQIEKASPYVPKKVRKNNTLFKKRQRVIKKVVPIPSIPKPIPKEDEEGDDE